MPLTDVPGKARALYEARRTRRPIEPFNTSAGRYLVGSAVPAAGIDLRLIGVVLEHNGEVTATGSSATRSG